MLADKGANQAAGYFEENEQAIIQAIQGAGTYEAAFEALLELLPNLNMSQAEELLSQSFFSSDLYGRWTVNREAKNAG